MIDIKRQMEPKIAARPQAQRLQYNGLFLLNDETILSHRIGHGAMIQLRIDQKNCLCPRGTEQEEMQTGVPLDTVLKLYVNRLVHSGVLSKLIHLVNEGGVEPSDVISLNEDGGAAVTGFISFDVNSHTVTFKPRDVLQTQTLYTVTLKSELMQVKKEISELGDNVGIPLSRLLDHPEYTCTFTTAASPWRRLTIRQRFEYQALPTASALRHLPHASITLRNDDEVFEALKVICAQALDGDVDEDDDILSIQRVRDPLDGANLQFEAINHASVASIADNDTLLVTLKTPEFEIEGGDGEERPARRQRVEDDVPAAAPATVEPSPATAATPAAMTPAGTVHRSARERITEARELLDAGMITQEEYDAKRREIINNI